MKTTCAFLAALVVALSVITGCSKPPSGPIQVSLSKDGRSCVPVIVGYWDAFNHFDLDKAVSFLDPTYAQTRTAGVQSDLDDFQQGKSLGVKMNVYSVTQAGVLDDGRLDLRVVMKITPTGLQADQYLMYYMLKEPDGSWKISRQTSDPDKTPPGAKPADIKFTVVSPTEVDITWTDKSTIETGYRIDRALDSSYQTEKVSFNLPANSNSYNDTSVKPGVKYWYRIVPFNKAGDCPSQNWPVTVPAAP